MMIRIDALLDKDIERLRRVKFFVEANSFEVQTLWKDWSLQYQREFTDLTDEENKVDWIEEMSGFWLTIDTVTIKKQKYPVNLAFTFATINDNYVCFYEGISAIVNHIVIDKFLRKNFPVKYDNDTRNAFTDANNFHHCAHFCLEKRNKRISFEKI